MSDNFHFDLTGVPLDLCLRVAFGPIPARGKERTALGWAEVAVDQADPSASKVWGAGKGTPKRLILFWTKHESMIAFPAPLTAGQGEQMVKSWLDQANYGPEPDHDGDNSRGFRVYNEAWTHVAGLWQAFVAIEPIWLLHGK